MKTKFKVLAGCAVAAIATVATVNVSLSMKSDRQQLSDLQLANVEALAQNENNINVITCYNTIRVSPKKANVPEPIWNVTFCNGCQLAECFEYKDSGTCTANLYHYV